MYEFPPQPQLMTTLAPMLWNVGTLVVACLLIGWLCFKKHEGPLFSSIYPSFFTGVVTFAATLFLLSAPSTFIIVLWLFATVATMWNINVAYRHDELPSITELMGLVLTSWVVIIVLLLPALHEPPIPPSPRTLCRNHLKQIGLALHNYHDDYQSFPVVQSGDPSHSWRVDLLPFVDQAPLFNTYNFDERWNEGQNEEFAHTKVLVYECPADRKTPESGTYPWTAYAALQGEQTIWPSNKAVTLSEVMDGSSNTLAVVEACGLRIPWCEPKDISITDVPVGVNLSGNKPHSSNGWMSSYHTGGVNVLLTDGAVKFLSENIDKEALHALSTRNGGEDVPDF